MWFNPGAAQKHFQMSFSGSESQKVNDNSSILTAPNLNANAAAGLTRSLSFCVFCSHSCLKHFSEVGVKIGKHQACVVGVQRGLKHHVI